MNPVISVKKPLRMAVFALIITCGFSVELAGAGALSDFIWVPNGVETGAVNKISKINDQIVATLSSGGTYPVGVAVDPNYVWVTNMQFGLPGTVVKFDKANGQPLATIEVGSSPRGIAVDPNFVWVANTGSGTITKIDRTSNTIVNTIPIPGPEPRTVAVDLDSVWVAYGQSDGRVAKIRKSDDTIIENISVAPYPGTVTADENFVWVSEYDQGLVYKIDKTDNSVTSFSVSQANSLAVDEDSVWVAQQPQNTVSRFNKTTTQELATITVGDNPYGLILDNESLWVTNVFSGTVTRINKADNTVAGTISGLLSPALIGDGSGYAYDRFFAQTNHPPVANAGSDQTINVGNNCQASVSLDGSGSSDPDNDPLIYTWVGPFGTANGSAPAVTLPLGAHTITLTVNDGKGGSSTDEVIVTSVDTIPPVISSATASPSLLWPADHRIIPVAVAATATDNCSQQPACAIRMISSNEPVGSGDAVIATPLTAKLRAERLGTGGGRVYTMTIGCTDASGNEATTNVTVTVPHDLGKK